MKRIMFIVDATVKKGGGEAADHYYVRDTRMYLGQLDGVSMTAEADEAKRFGKIEAEGISRELNGPRFGRSTTIVAVEEDR